MLQALLNLLPHAVTATGVAIAAIGAAFGLLLWVAGAHISRYVLTLTAVAIGTIVGLRLPGWMGWAIDGKCTGVAGAVVFGVMAYAAHRFCVSVACGIVLAMWAGFATWAIMMRDNAWQWPSRGSESFSVYFNQVWNNLPADVAHVLPVVGLAALLIGAVPAMMFPRLGLTFLYSGAGVAMFVAMGAMFVSQRHPMWLAEVPPKASAQCGVVVMAILIGTALQWQLNFRKPKPADDEKA